MKNKEFSFGVTFRFGREREADKTCEHDAIDVIEQPCAHCDVPLGKNGHPIMVDGSNSLYLRHGAIDEWQAVFKIDVASTDGVEVRNHGSDVIALTFRAPIAYCPICGRKL